MEEVEPIVIEKYQFDTLDKLKTILFAVLHQEADGTNKTKFPFFE